MLYRKVTIACKGAEERLNRVLRIRNDVDLLTLGYIILDSLKADFISPYVIEVSNIWYVFDALLEDDSFLQDQDGKELRALSEYHIGDLPENFTVKYFDNDFEYEEIPEINEMPWEFNCTMDPEEININNDKYAFMSDGKGMGIWENQRNAYFLYLDGKIDPDSSEDTENSWLPGYLNIKTYGETDTAFDLYVEKEIFEDGMYPDGLKDRVEMAVSSFEMDDDEDDYWDEEDDMFDFLDDHDESPITKGAMTIALACVASHAQSIDFVRDKFNELTEKYDMDTAIGMILEVVTEYIQKFVEGDLMKDNNEYRKKIENLK